MKITALKPYGLASPVSDWTYVKVETEEPGVFGWGECSLSGKTHGVQGAIRELEKLILGADPLNTERAW
jgi:galactonate dehydratase